MYQSPKCSAAFGAMKVIIKALRIRTTYGIGRIINHLQNADQNEQVSFLRGTPADVKDMHRDAVARGTAFSVRHWIVAPHEPTTRPQMRQVLEMLASEFGFEAGRAVVVEHRKKRSAADAFDVHWHVLVGEVDPATGRVLRSSFDRVIHELVARVSEHRFGHAFVHGKHSKAVIKGLRKRKLACIADKLETLVGAAITLPGEAFSHAQHQEKKRLGLDLPALRQIVKSAANSATSRTDLTGKLAAAGITLMLGDKPNTWIVRNHEGHLIGALHRLASKRKDEIDQLMAETPALETAPIVAPALAPDYPSFQEAQTSFQPAKISSRTDLLDQLRCLEKTSLMDANLVTPEYRESSDIREQRKKLRNQNAEVKALRDEKWERFEELQATEKMRWWFYPLGIAAKRRANALSLRRQIEAADRKIDLQCIAISADETRLFRSEMAEKEAYKNLVNQMAAKRKAARRNLENIAAAQEILTSGCEISFTGLDHLMEFAALQNREQHGAARARYENQAACESSQSGTSLSS